MPSSRHHPETPPQLNDLSFEQIEAIFQTGETLSIGKSQIVKNCTIEGTQYILKQYNASGPFTALRLKLGLSRAHNAFLFAKILNKNNIPAPHHLIIKSKINPVKSTTFLIMEKAPGTPLFDFIQADSTLHLSEQAIENTAKLIIKLQWLGIAHGDLHTRNLIIGPDQTVRIIDLDNAKLSKARRQKDYLRFTNAIKKGQRFKQPILAALEKASHSPIDLTSSPI